MDFLARSYYRKPHYLLIGPAGAVEWVGTQPMAVRLHHCHSSCTESSGGDSDAYVDEGTPCKYVESGRCWPVLLQRAAEPHLETLSSGDEHAVRVLLEQWYGELVASTRPASDNTTPPAATGVPGVPGGEEPGAGRSPAPEVSTPAGAQRRNAAGTDPSR